jgi:hypothetical protein
MDVFLCSKVDKVCIYDSLTFKELGEIPITLLKTETREPNQVIAIQKCQNEQYLAIISGKNLIMNEQKINQLFIFKREANKNPSKKDEFKFFNKTILKDIPIFKQVSMQFQFVNSSSKDRDSILFAKIDQLFTLNFNTGEVSMLYKFKQVFAMQPSFFSSNIE